MTFTNNVGAHMFEFSLMCLAFALLSIAYGVYDNQEVTAPLVVGAIVGAVLLGMLAGASQRADALAIGPEKLSIVQKCWGRHKNTTFSIRWDALHRVSVVDAEPYPLLVVWFRDRPTADWATMHNVRAWDDNGGYIVYHPAAATGWFGRDALLTRLRTALAHFAGGTYVSKSDD